MKQDFCERESEAIAAAHSNASSRELSNHVQSCPSCTEAQASAILLSQHAASLWQKDELPGANQIWRQAQRRKQELALKTATCILSIMDLLSGVYVFLLAIWLSRNLWQSLHLQLKLQWNATIAAGTATAFTLIALGSIYFIYLDQRSGNVFPLAGVKDIAQKL